MNPLLTVDTIIESIELLKQESRYNEARMTALEALTRHTDDYRLYEELADIYIFENNLEKADEVIGYARALHPASSTGIYLEGYIAVVR
jgi:tetratricopeptide (TPR) repeat protein